MSMKTPMAHVIGLGSAKDGVGHWWSQRLTAIALLPLSLLFAIPFGGAIGEGHAAVMALYGQPFHAIVAILFIAAAFYHLSLGLQVVIEDYVHAKGSRTLLLVGVPLGCVLFAAAGIFSVLKIAFA